MKRDAEARLQARLRRRLHEFVNKNEVRISINTCCFGLADPFGIHQPPSSGLNGGSPQFVRHSTPRQVMPKNSPGILVRSNWRANNEQHAKVCGVQVISSIAAGVILNAGE